MTQPVTVLPGSSGPAPAPHAGVSRGQKAAAALVALFVASGAAVFLLHDGDDGTVPVPRTSTHADLVREAGKACSSVTRTRYGWGQLVVESERLHQLTPPAADAARWSAALAALDAAVAVEQRADRARGDAAALRRLEPQRTARRNAAKQAFAAVGITACPG